MTTKTKAKNQGRETETSRIIPPDPTRETPEYRDFPEYTLPELLAEYDEWLELDNDGQLYELQLEIAYRIADRSCIDADQRGFTAYSLPELFTEYEKAVKENFPGRKHTISAEIERRITGNSASAANTAMNAPKPIQCRSNAQTPSECPEPAKQAIYRRFLMEWQKRIRLYRLSLAEEKQISGKDNTEDISRLDMEIIYIGAMLGDISPNDILNDTPASSFDKAGRIPEKIDLADCLYTALFD